jgi:hypothetical protein
VRTALVSVLGLVLCLILYFRTQWDADGEPMKTWDWIGAAPISPTLSFGKWFIRSSPITILVLLGAISVAFFVMR